VTAGTVPIAPQATAPSADAKADAPALNPSVAATFEQPMARSFASREIVPLESSVRWRLAGDRVERSTDSGNSWISATRLDAGAIIAGSAPGPLVCWLAGRAGIVFLATDGVTFRQVTSPVTADLVAVTAVDATSATVTTGDGRRFSTTNGGATWNPAAVR
jgi:photosystem II stability/assembly factor-like uncharacterized protein